MDNGKYVVIGNNIRRFRKQYSYSQERLAELIDISTNHLHRIETAKTHISLSLLLKMAETFRVEISELLKDEVSVNKEVLWEIEEILTKSNEKEKEIIRQTVVKLHYTLKSIGV